MSSLEKIIQSGKALGFEGPSLQEFVRTQQALEREREAKAYEIEQRKLAADSDRLESETEKLKLEMQLMQQKLALQQMKAEQGYDEPQVPNNPTPRPRLPVFSEKVDSIDSFLSRFEAYAESQRWNPDGWAISLAALLSGKALQIFSALGRAEQRDYEKVKESLLKGFELTEEGFRRRFRQTRIQPGETFPQFGVRVEHYFNRWIELSGVDKTFEGLKDLLMREQILSSCSPELVVHVKQSKVQTSAEMIETAENFREARVGVKQPNFGFGQRPPKPKGERLESSADMVVRQGMEPNKEQGNVRQGDRRECFLCHKRGHLARDCRWKPQKSAAMRGTSEAVETCSTGKATGEVLLGIAGKEPGMPIVDGFLGDSKVKVLRDTGSSCCVVRSTLVRDDQLTGEFRQCKLIDGTEREFEVAVVQVDTPYFRGELKCLVMANPLWDLIIGNVPGARKPDDPDTTPVATSAAVETRSQTKKQKQKPLKVDTTCISATPAEIAAAQKADVSLKPLWAHADDKDVQYKFHGMVKYFEENSLLYREYTNTRHGKVTVQLVVPKDFRKTVLSLGHEGHMSGHLGKGKTADRILSNFYWPGVLAEVKRFCASCDICQRSAPKGRTPKAPLEKMPLIEDPFHRVAIDLIGPISPASQSGHRYILTMVDFATRYPEAVALKGIDTIQVAEALLEFFSRVGVPSQILSDQGSQFMSEVMKEVARLLGVKQLHSTPYHPQCDGLVERFNGSLKAMLKRMCCEQPQNWDRFLPAALFAYREVPQSSLGFSPFELLYGRMVRGPVSILKELWTQDESEPEVRTTYQYVVDLKQRLEDTCKYAQEELGKNSEVYRRHFNKKAKSRHFPKGSKVLLLLPTDHNKLLLHWKGPFTVLDKSGLNDYLLDIGGKKKLFHANMLRQYVEREDDDSVVGTSACGVSVVQDVETPGEGNLHFPTLKSEETHENVNVFADLEPKKKEEIRRFVEKRAHTFSDLPGQTDLELADIQLDTKDPVKANPYPLPYATREIIGAEVKKMLDMGIIEKSKSPFCSPLVAVKKADGSHRVCVDLRALNRHTVLDSEPMPNIEDLYAQLATMKGKYFSKLDLSKGYWQIRLTEQSREKTAFSTPLGLFQFKVLPFGWVNAGAVFTRMMRKLLDGLEGVVNFMDDICVASETWEEHMKVLNLVFDRLEKAGLTARPSKCYLGYPSLQFLGFEIGQGEKKPEQQKVEKILDAPQPKTKKEVRSLLGLVGYYREFVPNFSAVTAPLSDLTKKGNPDTVVWTDATEKAFISVKKNLASFPILRLPDFSY